MRQLLIAVVVAVAHAANPAAAKEPSRPLPTGIPAPPFGLEESVQSVYGSQDYHTHWIDNTMPGCSDDSATGTPARPRCSLPVLTSLPAGSVVQLRGGPYVLRSTLMINGAGTQARPIIIRGDRPGGVTIQAGRQRQTIVGRASYVIVENLKFTGRDEALVLAASDHVSVRDCEFVGTGTSVDRAGAVITAGDSSFVVRARNIIHDAGDWRALKENDMHGLGVGTGQHDIWDLFNTVYHVAGDGVGNGHNANHTSYNLFIGGNTFYENRENAIDLKEVHNVIISENVAHTFVTAPGDSSARGEAIVLHYGPTSGQGPYNVWVLNNLIYDSGIGIAASNVGAKQYWIGNVIYHCGAAMLINASSGGEFGVFHNTLVDNGAGEWWGVNADKLVVGGNIVADVTNGVHMRVDPALLRTRAVFSNELYYQRRGSVGIGWPKLLTSVRGWMSMSGTGKGSIQSDPLFTDAAARDYTLQPKSPAIRKGVNMSAIASLFASSFGTSLLRDRAGHPRPDGVWDIGAYQFAGGKGRTGSER